MAAGYDTKDALRALVHMHRHMHMHTFHTLAHLGAHVGAALARKEQRDEHGHGDDHRLFVTISDTLYEKSGSALHGGQMRRTNS